MVYVSHSVEQEKKLLFNGRMEIRDGSIQKTCKVQLSCSIPTDRSLTMAKKKKNQSVSKAWSKTKKK